MPKTNPYLIPKENQIKTEEVRYLNTEIPSYEEFMKTYEANERVNASYYEELEAQEKGYGPCYYCPYEVESWRPGGKHINRCGSLNCSYYRRIVDNKVVRGVGHGISTGAAIGF